MPDPQADTEQAAMSREEWDCRYDEAMQWRDWDTCEYLLSIRPPQWASEVDP